MSTRQQRWSLSAHEAVKGFAKASASGKLNTLCMKAPALIQRSGAVQALAFIISREEGERFVNALADTYEPNMNGQRLLTAAQKAKLPEYLALTRDLLEVAAWYRRFAQIELAGVEDQDR